MLRDPGFGQRLRVCKSLLAGAGSSLRAGGVRAALKSVKKLSLKRTVLGLVPAASYRFPGPLMLQLLLLSGQMSLLHPAGGTWTRNFLRGLC